MDWVRLDVGYFSNPKVLRAGRDASLLHLAAVCYLGAHNQGDGELPVEAIGPLAKLVHIDRPGPVVDRLVSNALFEQNGSGLLIVHDFDSLNGSRSEAALAAARQRRLRERRRHQRDGDA